MIEGSLWRCSDPEPRLSPFPPDQSLIVRKLTDEQNRLHFKQGMKRQRKTLTKHERTIAEHERTIAEHERTIAEHERTIAKQGEAIANHLNAIKVKDTLYLEAGMILNALIGLLTDLVELKDPYTKGHSQRVTNMSILLAEQGDVQFPSDKLTVLKYAALLHDIGKVAISDFVLTKPTLLTEAEKLMIQQHTVLDHRLVAPLDLDPMIASVALSHHENYDGSGYPSGLKGEAIPLAARIVKLADVYDALTSSRPYRSAYSPKQAVVIIKKQQQELDPYLLDRFLNIVTKHS